MLTGFNHLTLSCSNLDQSIRFYCELLGLKLNATWAGGAYLSLPGLWLCLTNETTKTALPQPEYTHYAFSIKSENISKFREILQAAGVTEWKQNHSEGGSYYFLDPDGHKLEAHAD
jgi:catechol 2,3-dioxygenase-like lactoylglutathione lyase family enzyme